MDYRRPISLRAFEALVEVRDRDDEAGRARPLIDHLREVFPLARWFVDHGRGLTVRGAVMVGPCPFHVDRLHRDTLTVRGEEFVCSACSAAGSIVDAVMRAHGLSAPAAVARLVAEAGDRVPPRPAPRYRHRDGVWASESGRWFVAQGDEAQHYRDEIVEVENGVEHRLRRIDAARWRRLREILPPAALADIRAALVAVHGLPGVEKSEQPNLQYEAA